LEKELKLFKDLFQPFPNISILHINNGAKFIDAPIKEVVDFLDGNLEYIEFMEENSARIKATAREYEYIVLSDILSYCPNRDKVLKLMYKALENSANIIVLEKKSNKNMDEIKQLLDESSFVAINHIDLFEEYNLITAKKLHMWGSGL
jgi:ubiquinone/menaquinone biosynthesis C-methylase UbiE